MISIQDNNNGFTLIELLVAMAISGIVMAGVYSAYYSQQKSYIAQEQIAGMQQNLRAAMYFMEREIRMAGCDPNGTADAGIKTAGMTSINFTEDVRGTNESDPPNGNTNDPNEDITYSLYTAADGIQKLGRNAGTNQAVAENIDALDFVYLDGDGSVTATISEIRSVQITVVARTGRPDPGYSDTANYTNQQGTEILAAQNDNFRRRRLTAEVLCRNLGL